MGTTSGSGKLIVQDSIPKIQANYNGTTHLEFGTGGSGCGFAMTTGLFTSFNHQPYADRGTDNNLTERMRIDSSGRLLLGTTTEGYSSADDLTLATSGHTGITVRSGSSSDGNIFFSRGTSGNDELKGYIQYNHASDFMRFATAHTERVRITNSTDGELLIGTTNGANNSGPGVKLSGGSASTVDVVIDAASNINLNHVYNINATNNGYRFYIMANGGVVNFSGSNVTLSDEREKKNIVDMDSTWSELKQWTLRQFHFNEQDNSEDKCYGVIAQQIETVSPQVLSTFETNPTTTRKGVKEQKMMWMAIKALQEAQDRIETLEQRLSDAGIA